MAESSDLDELKYFVFEKNISSFQPEEYGLSMNLLGDDAVLINLAKEAYKKAKGTG